MQDTWTVSEFSESLSSEKVISTGQACACASSMTQKCVIVNVCVNLSLFSKSPLTFAKFCAYVHVFLQ